MPCVVCGEARITQGHHVSRRRIIDLCPTCHFLHHHKGLPLVEKDGRWHLGEMGSWAVCGETTRPPFCVRWVVHVSLVRDKDL